MQAWGGWEFGVECGRCEAPVTYLRAEGRREARHTGLHFTGEAG